MPALTTKEVGSIETLLSEVKKDLAKSRVSSTPWFRGEPAETDTPLTPKLFRGSYHENKLLQHFRMKAPLLGLDTTPPRDHTDQWLFLARHVGLPTRLLDWTEGLLHGLYFALHSGKGEPRQKDDGAVVWMLEPVSLNRLASGSEKSFEDDQFPLTWFSPEAVSPRRGEVVDWFSAAAAEDRGREAFREAKQSMTPNIGSANIRYAWGEKNVGIDLPVAVHATSIHPRITVQKGCFTVHGRKEESLTTLAPAVLSKYVVKKDSFDRIREDLRLAGITYSTLFPDLDGLAVDLTTLFQSSE